MQQRSRHVFAQPRKTLMGNDHAVSRINLCPLDGVPDALPVQLERFAASGPKLERELLIGLRSSCLDAWPDPALESVGHGFVLRFDLAPKFQKDRISSPMGRASAETGETDVADRDDIRLDQVAVIPEARVIAEIIVPIAIDIHDRTFESRENLEEASGAFGADVTGDNDRVE